MPGAPAVIGHAERSRHERGDRPAVGGDVMNYADQHVFVIGDAEKSGPQGDLAREIE